MCWTAVEAATPQALADLLQSSGRYTNGTPWPASRQMDNGRGDGTTTCRVQEHPDVRRHLPDLDVRRHLPDLTYRDFQTSTRAANFQTYLLSVAPGARV